MENTQQQLSSDLMDMPLAILSEDYSSGCAEVSRLPQWKAPYLHKPMTTLDAVYKKNDIINEKYEVKDICNGSMGTVFHCYDRIAKVEVAIKTLIVHSKTNRIRVYGFYEEVMKRIRLSPHRNVVKFRLVEQIHGYPYIVSQWIEGDPIYGNSLESWMQHYKFELEEIVDFLQQICAGLLHCSRELSTDEEPFVLGDLKPENILVTKEQKYLLADFSTHSYTPGWASPEQLRRERLDERSDIYTLGRIAKLLFEAAKKPEEKKALAASLEQLISSCTEDNLKKRMSSLKALRICLDKLCEEFSLSKYTSETVHQGKSFLDSMYQLYSKINLGMPINTFNSLSDQSWILSGGRFLNGVEEFAEYIRHPDRETYEAEAVLRSGNIKKALELLEKIGRAGISSKTSRYFYVYGLAYIYSGELKRGVKYLNAACEKELYLPALDAKADTFIKNPDLLKDPLLKNDVKETLDRFFKVFYDNSDGFLSNQIYGKYLMLMEEYAFASRAFQESLFYPNASEWINLYYYGVCEYRQKNIYKALAVFASTIQVIETDADYMSNFQKAVMLLDCHIALADKKKAEVSASAIKERYQADYQGRVDALCQDYCKYQTWQELLREIEAQCGNDGDSLQKRLHIMMDKLEQERPIENAFLLGSIANMISSRETALLFNKQRYTEASAVCDRALAYDHCHPLILKNKGACLLMEGNPVLAEACYRLSAFYEQDAALRQETQNMAEKIRAEHPDAF